MFVIGEDDGVARSKAEAPSSSIILSISGANLPATSTKAVLAAKTLASKSDHFLCEKLFDNPSMDILLLSFFNLQNYAQGDWDHPNFSESECLLGLQFIVYIFCEPVLISAYSISKRCL